MGGIVDYMLMCSQNCCDKALMLVGQPLSGLPKTSHEMIV